MAQRTAYCTPASIFVVIVCVIAFTYFNCTYIKSLSLQDGLPNSRQVNLNQGSDLIKYADPPPAVKATVLAEMMVEQNRRKALIDRVCSEANISREVDLSHDEISPSVWHIIVDDEYKLLFGFIPKVGCTTWKSFLRRVERLHPHHRTPHWLLASLSRNVSAIRYRLENYRKVLFVREPITRMLSCYLSKLRGAGRARRKWEEVFGKYIVRKYRGFDPEVKYQDMEDKPYLNITLPEFIRFITDLGNDIKWKGPHDPWQLSDHFMPLNNVALPCQIRYDFIGYHENLEVEADLMLRWLGIGDLIQFPKEHGTRASNTFIEEYSQVPLDLIKRLSDYYELDYKMFGYQVNDTLSYLMKGIFLEDEKDEDNEEDEDD